MDDQFKDTAEGKEIHDIRVNSTNPRHSAFLKGDKDATDYVSGLYQRLYTGQAGETPVAKSAREEIDKIRTDKSHPMNAKYIAGDPEAKAHVENLYRSLVPEGEPELVPPEVAKENVRRMVGMEAGAEFDTALANVQAVKDRFPIGPERNAFFEAAAAIESALGEEGALKLAFKLFGGK